LQATQLIVASQKKNGLGSQTDGAQGKNQTSNKQFISSPMRVLAPAMKLILPFG